MVSPLTNIFFPTESLGRLCVATTTVAASGGAAALKTATIGNEYPPIDLSIPSPVLAMIAVQDGATMIANGAQAWSIANQCDGVPDSADEFQITAARTIDVWQEANETLVILIVYISKGTGQKK